MKNAIPLMEETDGGSIVNISSVYGLRGAVGGASSAYQATKGGVTVLTKNAANGYADSVRVNSVHPGYIETPMTEDADELAEVFLRDTPMGRSGSPEEVAKVVYFLASDLSTYVTGENIAVDGGYLSH
jgi:NAD(P)-dependent dehydrogenase (short-subunit alcohol dehydrogenase family)